MKWTFVFVEACYKSYKTEKTKVPQIGWNNIYRLNTTLFNGIAENSFCYFVHGYYATLGEQTIATTEYGLEYSAALNYKNYFGVQFHPEKSHGAGHLILSKFIQSCTDPE